MSRSDTEAVFLDGRGEELIEAYEGGIRQWHDTELPWVGRAYLEARRYGAARELLARAVSRRGWTHDWARQAFHDATWRDEAEFDRASVPNVLGEQLALFAGMIRDIVSGRDIVDRAGDIFDPATLSVYYIKTVVSEFHLTDLEDEALTTFREAGVSEAFLQAAGTGHLGVSDARKRLLSFLPFLEDENVSPHMIDVIAGIMLGGKPTFCPFSGSIKLVGTAIDANTYRHVHDKMACIIVCDRTAEASSDRAWLFLEGDLLLTPIRDVTITRALSLSLTRLVQDAAAYKEHFGFQGIRKVMVSDATVGHLGHYIWNVISGWSKLFTYVSPSRIDILTTERHNQFLGGVKELYRSEYESIGRHCEVESFEQNRTIMLEERALYFTLFDCYVTNDLADRVVRWARDTTPGSRLDDIDKFRDEHSPVLLVTLRLENRAWVEQDVGIPQILNSLAGTYPRIGVIIDGLNADVPGGDSHAFMSLQDELELSNRIVAACPGIDFRNSIGCDRAESIVLCHSADVSLAPIGAGMAKTRWIANKPTVAYSNETCLAMGNYDGRLYERFRDDPAPILYIDKRHVHDVEGERHGLKFRANFSMPGSVVVGPVTHLIELVLAETVFSLDTVRIESVVLLDGIWHVNRGVGGMAMPLRLGGQDLVEFQSGWQPRHLVVGFGRTALLELVHQSGRQATWYVDAFSLDRRAGSVAELRADVARQFMDRIATTGLPLEHVNENTGRELADHIRSF